MERLKCGCIAHYYPFQFTWQQWCCGIFSKFFAPKIHISRRNDFENLFISQILSCEFGTLSDITMRRCMRAKSLLCNNTGRLSWVSSLFRIGSQCIGIKQCTSKCLHTDRCQYCIAFGNVHYNEMPTTTIIVWIVAISRRRHRNWFADSSMH